MRKLCTPLTAHSLLHRQEGVVYVQLPLAARQELQALGRIRRVQPRQLLPHPSEGRQGDARFADVLPDPCRRTRRPGLRWATMPSSALWFSVSNFSIIMNKNGRKENGVMTPRTPLAIERFIPGSSARAETTGFGC